MVRVTVLPKSVYKNVESSFLHLIVFVCVTVTQRTIVISSSNIQTRRWCKHIQKISFSISIPTNDLIVSKLRHHDTPVTSTIFTNHDTVCLVLWICPKGQKWFQKWNRKLIVQTFIKLLLKCSNLSYLYNNNAVLLDTARIFRRFWSLSP